MNNSCKRTVTCEQLSSLKTTIETIETQNGAYTTNEAEFFLRIGMTIKKFPENEQNQAFSFFNNLFTLIEKTSICVYNLGYSLDTFSMLLDEFLIKLLEITNLISLYEISNTYLQDLTTLLPENCKQLLEILIERKDDVEVIPKAKGGVWGFCRRIKSGISASMYWVNCKIPDNVKVYYSVFEKCADWMCVLDSVELIKTASLLAKLFFPIASSSYVLSIIRLFCTFKRSPKAGIRQIVGGMNVGLEQMVKEKERERKKQEELEQLKKELEIETFKGLSPEEQRNLINEKTMQSIRLSSTEKRNMTLTNEIISDKITPERENKMKEFLRENKSENLTVINYLKNFNEIRRLDDEITALKDEMQEKNIIPQTISGRPDKVAQSYMERVQNRIEKRDTLIDDNKRLENLLTEDELRNINNITSIRKTIKEIEIREKIEETKPSRKILELIKQNRLFPDTTIKIFEAVQPIQNIEDEWEKALLVTAVAGASAIRIANLNRNWKLFQRPLTNIFRPQAQRLKLANELKDGYRPLEWYFSVKGSIYGASLFTYMFSDIFYENILRYDPENIEESTLPENIEV